MRHSDRVQESNGLKYIRLETGRVVFLSDAVREFEKNTSKVRLWAARTSKLTSDDRDLERYGSLLDDLERLLVLHREELARLLSRRKTEDRIASLRNINGRSSEEAAAYLAKADELERTLVGGAHD